MARAAGLIVPGQVETNSFGVTAKRQSFSSTDEVPS